ncbi:DUF2637 domain-containing protein [Pseudarthrobacter sp. BIM B-2242]|uniref:DUF2637 domain-containing protein n=1 Tax=Pseudarthrobacter sp. BIM B-2242 TaxID=2772401 RepID=UPI00168A676C|nr:DUF2637 domain-containing protein [Pseudarthrobacter sp. BIM B-2242]QOD05812.1 DUF2637 domain-containing protein [Pseudarthrobacter sp. BIM B-2242]
MTSTPPRRTGAPLSRPIVATGIATTVLIAAGAFVLSFASLTDLAARAGIYPSLAWIWPIIIDGLIVAATVAIVALAGHDRRTLAYPWALLFLGAVVSTAANSVHAIITVDQNHGGVPPAVSAVVAAMPPLVLLAITHLTVILVQKAAPAPAPKKKPARAAGTRRAAVSSPASEPVPAPEPSFDTEVAAVRDDRPVHAPQPERHHERELVSA